MIGWGDICKVVAATVPLYVALALGYGSVRWWRVLSPEQCVGVNRLVSFFTLPLFTLDFALHCNPYAVNYRFIAADLISKLLAVPFLLTWLRCSTKESFGWSITSFSLLTSTNSLVVGVPLLKAMYGSLGADLVVQSFIFQAIVWLTLLLFLLEFRQVSNELSVAIADAATAPAAPRRIYFLVVARKVCVKLAANPNSYACYVGLVWSLLANRWGWRMPAVVEDSVQILSRAGTGTAMFSMGGCGGEKEDGVVFFRHDGGDSRGVLAFAGLFMALQERLLGCGVAPSVFGMVMRFVAGPVAMAIGSVAVGLRGEVLGVAVVQAALPQSIISFVFARDYGLHADVISTAVILGMFVSLPVMVGYYVLLAVCH